MTQSYTGYVTYGTNFSLQIKDSCCSEVCNDNTNCIYLSQFKTVLYLQNRDLLIRAFQTYVCLILEFNSPVLSPSLTKDILRIESVQRKFTKTMPGLAGLTYYSRLKSKFG